MSNFSFMPQHPKIRTFPKHLPAPKNAKSNCTHLANCVSLCYLILQLAWTGPVQSVQVSSPSRTEDFNIPLFDFDSRLRLKTSRKQFPRMTIQLSDTNEELAFRLSDIQIPETISFAARSDFHMRPTSLEKQHVSRECRSQGIPIQSCPQRL